MAEIFVQFRDRNFVTRVHKTSFWIEGKKCFTIITEKETFKYPWNSIHRIKIVED